MKDLSSTHRKVRKPINRFIHNPESDWSKCIITKRPDSITYLTKPKTDFNVASDTNKKVLFNFSHGLPVTLNGKIIEYLPKSLVGIYQAIEASKYILGLEDNFDDNGSVKYSIDVWKKAILYISRLSSKIYKSNGGKIIPTPKIYHGPNGSIDLYWEYEAFNLLVNIPPIGMGSFYGDDYGNNKVEGIIDTSQVKLNILPFLIDFE